MGDIADMMLDGTLDHETGEYQSISFGGSGMSDHINTGGPAYPQSERIAEDKNRYGVVIPAHTLATGGMTKREVAAIAAMQGILVIEREHFRPSAVAHDAVAYADALIAALGEGQ